MNFRSHYAVISIGLVYAILGTSFLFGELEFIKNDITPRLDNIITAITISSLLFAISDLLHFFLIETKEVSRLEKLIKEDNYSTLDWVKTQDFNKDDHSKISNFICNLVYGFSFVAFMIILSINEKIFNDVNSITIATFGVFILTFGMRNLCKEKEQILLKTILINRYDKNIVNNYIKR